MFRFTIRDLLWLMVDQPEDEEDDGLNISWPVGVFVNCAGAVVLALIVARWAGCG